jgi:CHAD domain-containing protein
LRRANDARSRDRPLGPAAGGKEPAPLARKILSSLRVLAIPAIASQVRLLVKKKAQPDLISANLRRLLQKCGNRWNGTVDRYLVDDSAESLHDVRIKAKSLRYAIEFSQHFYPDRKLGHASEWLKEIQDQVGAWHHAPAAGAPKFLQSHPTHDPDALKLIRDIKEKELAMAGSAHAFLSSARKAKHDQRLERDLAALVYAMTNANDAEAPPSNGRLN